MVSNAFINWCLDILCVKCKGQRWRNGIWKIKAKLLNEAQSKVTFNDVAGVEEAKEEVEEIVEF